MSQGTEIEDTTGLPGGDHVVRCNRTENIIADATGLPRGASHYFGSSTIEQGT